MIYLTELMTECLPSLEDVSEAGNSLLEVLLESLKFLILVDFGVAASKDLRDAGGRDWMVEVLVLLEPRATGVVLARVLERLVHGHQVLGATH